MALRTFVHVLCEHNVLFHSDPVARMESGLKDICVLLLYLHIVLQNTRTNLYFRQQYKSTG